MKRASSLGLVCSCLLLCSCVERLLQIRTEPDGARVLVNGELVMVEANGEKVPATTPVDVPFDSYGTFEIEVRREEHATQRLLVPVSAPWYSYPPIDFFAEALWPWQIDSHHPIEIDLELTKKLGLEEQAVIDRSNSLRARLEKTSHRERE